MLKAIIGLLISIIIINIGGVCLGFAYVYEHMNLEWMISFLSIYISLLIATIVCIYIFIKKSIFEVNEFISKVTEFVNNAIEQIRALSIMDIVKIVIKLVKK